jgi:tensin
VGGVPDARIFAFVARKTGSRTENACHVFAELESGQPATAVVNFVTKVMMALIKPAANTAHQNNNQNNMQS